MAGGSRKQITFDLRQAALRQYYPGKALSLNPQRYKKAYRDIQNFMVRNGFEHRQYSVYTSLEKLSVVDVVRLMGDLGQEFPWLAQCVNEIDVTNIGAQHSLKEVLGAASTAALDLENQDELRGLDTENLEEPDTVIPLKAEPSRKRKKKNTPER